MPSSKNDIKDQILEDAIKTAFEAEIKNIKLKIAVYALFALSVVELLALVAILMR